MKSHPRNGFTLIELLVVIGVMTVLIGLLFPILRSARRASTDVQCANNMRQITIALVGYASANHGAFPPNLGQSNQLWHNKAFLGPHISTPIVLDGGGLAGGVMRCPQDRDDAIRSYAMNVFASGAVSDFIRRALESNPPRGKLFKMGTNQSSALILLVESWSDMPLGNPIVGYGTAPVVGFQGKPGERFGAGGGVVWNGLPGATPGRFNVRASQIAFYRHRRSGPGAPAGPPEEPVGAAYFAFADGHVELLRHDEVADLATGKSTYRAMWSTIDRDID